MRLVIQRVKKAAVTLPEKKKIKGSINKGLLVLVGVSQKDSKRKATEAAVKLSKLRIMADKEGKMNLSVKDVGGKILVVSQFTLHADTSAGNRPSFIKAAEPKVAEEIYEHFISELKGYGVKVETGSFGDYMEIEAVLDGPVTILTESEKLQLP